MENIKQITVFIILQLKFEKKEAKRQEMLIKRQEQMQLKADALLLKKMMKNPKMHPGYSYPMSKQTDQLLEVSYNSLTDSSRISEMPESV